MIRALIVASVLCFPSFAEATGQQQIIQQQRVVQRQRGQFFQRFRRQNVVRERVVVQQFNAGHQFQQFKQQRFYGPQGFTIPFSAPRCQQLNVPQKAFKQQAFSNGCQAFFRGH